MYMWLKNKFEADNLSEKENLNFDLASLPCQKMKKCPDVLDIPNVFWGGVTAFARTFNEFSGPVRKFEMTKSQNALLQLLASTAGNRVVCLGARQSGKTEICLAYALWAALTNSYKKIAYFAPSLRMSKTAFERTLAPAKKMMQKFDVKSCCFWQEITFENHSKIAFSGTISDYMENYYDIVICDEFAFIDKKQNNLVTTAFDRLTSRNPESQIFLVSSVAEHCRRCFSEEEENNLFNLYWRMATCGSVPNADGWIAYKLSPFAECKRY